MGAYSREGLIRGGQFEDLRYVDCFFCATVEARYGFSGIDAVSQQTIISKAFIQLSRRVRTALEPFDNRHSGADLGGCERRLNHRQILSTAFAGSLSA